MKTDDIDLTPIEINGEEYYTVKQFAILTNRTQQSVRFLISKGNRVRKLMVKYLGGKPFVRKDELTDFPFTVAGRNLIVFHYTEDGEIQEELDDSREVANA